MGDVLPFKRPSAAKRSTLCANGHHRWIAAKGNPFDVKQGRLVTRYRCARCGMERVEAR
jgi:hypothetical protein